MYGLARTGSSGSGDSGDYVIAFSVAPELRMTSAARSNPVVRPAPGAAVQSVPMLSNDAMSPLFLAVIEATEEAIYNSLLRATTTTGNGRTVEALPLEPTLQILRAHKLLGDEQ
jgi:D-aminopeptidase